MTEKQARKIRSLAANGVPYINIHDEETEELMMLVQDMTKRNVPKEAIFTEEQVVRYVPTFECPNCHNRFTGALVDFCYHCGQAVSFENFYKKRGEPADGQ